MQMSQSCHKWVHRWLRMSLSHRSPDRFSWLISGSSRMWRAVWVHCDRQQILIEALSQAANVVRSRRSKTNMLDEGITRNQTSPINCGVQESGRRKLHGCFKNLHTIKNAHRLLQRRLTRQLQNQVRASLKTGRTRFSFGESCQGRRNTAVQRVPEDPVLDDRIAPFNTHTALQRKVLETSKAPLGS